MRSVSASVLLSLSLIAQCACGDSISERAAQDKVESVAADDPAMLKAFEKARRTLSEFLIKAKAPQANSSSYSVKVRITSGSDVEYFWVSPFSNVADNFSGTLANDGELVTAYRAGREIQFSQADIVDWLYRDDARGIMHGNFTACALLTHEDPIEAEEFRKEYGLQCDAA
jgi:uncharacterized protein YegJ (DUF2314 family)